MKLPVTNFRGMLPITSGVKLPDGYATTALNTKLTSGDIEGYYDIGNPFQLAKAAPIFTLEQIPDSVTPSTIDWLQWSASEKASFAFDIRAVPGPVVGDTTNRRYITGYNAFGGVPQFTNSFFATDPSQQGLNALYAYPYVTYKLGIADPVSIPSVSTATPDPVVTDYNFAQEASVNEALIDNAGTNYKIGDKLLFVGGTLVTGFTSANGAAQLTVLDVDPVTGAITEVDGITRGGFYKTDSGPGSTTINQVGLALPSATITLASVSGIPTSGSISVQSSAGEQMVGYTGISGLTLTGCTGGTGNVVNGTPVQPQLISTTLSGGSGTGATVKDVVVVANNFNGFDQFNTNNGDGYYSTWTIGQTVSSAPNQWNVATGQGDLTISYSVTAFGLLGCSSFVFQADMYSENNPDLVMWLAGTYNGTNQLNGPAVVLNFNDGLFTLFSSISGTNGNAVNGVIVEQVSGSFAYQQYRIRAEATQTTVSTSKGFNVIVTLALAATPSTIIATLQGFIPYNGDQVGVGTNHRGNHNAGNDGAFENLYVGVTTPASNITVESTNYVYTYVQQMPSDPLTQESGPSDPSQTIDVYINGTTNPAVRSPVTVIIPPAPTGENIAFYNLYRLVLDDSGDETYTFVTQLAASTTAPVSYVDSLSDTAIGPNVLISADWAPPPANMQGILALPNGIMAGFFENVLCLSAQNYPHAWPVGNQYATDTNIQGLSAIDTTVLLLTQAFPYTAFGTDPSAFNMSKEVSIQGCVATRSIATHKKYGIIFSSGNGLCYYKGQGLLDLIRIGPNEQPPFSYEQWQKLVPSTMIGELHDDYYYFWYNNGTTLAGFVLDLSPGGFGLISIDVHVSEAYVDKSKDALYLVPDLSVYPVNGAIVNTALNVVSQWEAATTMRPRVWARKSWLLPRPAAFARARVRYGVDTENDPVTGTITLTANSEIGTAFNGFITGQNIFTMASQSGIRWDASLAITGYLAVNSLEMAEASTELLD